MIMTRTPLRICLGGGGTDLPSYYREFGGFVISAAINRYVYIAINRSFLPGYFLKYSDTEHAQTLNEIRHPLLREALMLHDAPCPLEIVSVADVPAGTGLGSSGAFLVGLIHALYAHKRQRVTAEMLAQEAVEIEMNRLNEPVGKQDQYVAAYGGLLCQEYRSDDSVKVTLLAVSETALRELRESLMLFFVGQTRSSSALLDDQRRRSEKHDRAMLESLHFVKQLGEEIRRVLEAGVIHEFGSLMHEHWLRKRSRSSGMTNDRVDELYELARARGGATGGKLVGAGGNGFLLLHTQDRKRLRTAMADAGAREMEFSFDFDGSAVMVRNT
jgi:D-glycero-alpha-D-manno-heptose-7-phosphate kinase